MTSIALRSSWRRRRQLIGTFLAVVLGVSFLSGTLVLGATLERNFDQLFADANGGTDALVRSDTNVVSDAGFERGPISDDVIERVRDVDGVAAVAAYVQGYGQLLDKTGEPIGGNGPPRFAASWVTDPELNAYRLAEGRAPRREDEVVVNRGAAESGDLAVGDTTILQTPQPLRVRIVGIATFASADGFGTTTYAALPLRAAQRLVLGRTDRVTSIRVKAAGDVSEEQLVERIDAVLQPGMEAITGAQLTKENTDDLGAEFLDQLQAFLIVFAVIALLVGAFSIFNTLSILAAQRTRELALLRALGASRRQVRDALLAESLLIGVSASFAGLVGGLVIATLLKALFDAFGGALPDGGLVVTPASAVISIAVGVVVTALAGLAPARRAARVAPVAAMREIATADGLISRRRAILGAGLTATGVAAMLIAAVAGGLGLAIGGAVLMLAGMLTCAPLAARPVAALVGAPLPRLSGVSGVIARENAMRNPRRTAGTASALMVGVGVVTLFTIVAGSLGASVEDRVNRSFAGDLAITTPAFGGGALDPRLAERVRALPEIDGAVGLGRGAVRLAGASEQVSVADPSQLARVVALEQTAGVVSALGERALGVSATLAEEKGWRVGSRIPIRFPDGARDEFTVGVIYANAQIAGDVLVSRRAWSPHDSQQLDYVVFLTAADDVALTPAVRAVQRLTRGAGDAEVQTREQYVEASAAGIDVLLGIVYVLLLLAIVIALMGIANTLSLAIHERTRELGLLRAVGATRSQVRAIVRGESFVVAIFGTAGGLVAGAIIGWAVVRAADDADTLTVFAVPVAQLVAVLVAGAVVGVLASVRPARRAARLDVLRAIGAQ